MMLDRRLCYLKFSHTIPGGIVSCVFIFPEKKFMQLRKGKDEM